MKASTLFVKAIMAIGYRVPLYETPTTVPMINATTIKRAPDNPAAVPACAANGVTAPAWESGE